MTRGAAALVLSADLLGAFLVARLFLSAFIANNALVRGRPLRGLWHTLLPAMLSALILHAFEIVFFRHLLFLVHPSRSVPALDMLVGVNRRPTIATN
jgi:hypothetical protein